MMKKTYLYALVLLLLAANGCKKQIDQDPHNGIPSEDAFITPDDFTNAIRGAYSSLRGLSYYGGQDNDAMTSTPDVLADNLVLNQQGRHSQLKFYTYNYVSTDTWELWGNAYRAILRTNFILLNIDNLPEGEFKDNVHGEALAIRALAHFDLLRVYAKAYAEATDADPGVPYVTTVDFNAQPSRTPVREAYGLVANDFVQSIQLLGLNNGPGRIHKAAAEGLLSRVYLYMEQWQNCVDMATAAIDDAPASNALASIDEFPAIWTDETERDVLFKIRNLDADDDPIGVGYKQGTPEGVLPEYSVDYAFFQLFSDDDVRKNAYIAQTNFNGIDYNYVYKYNGRPVGDADVVDIKVIRMGEVYLNRAEAYYQLDNEAAALADLNTLRSNRYAEFSNGTETGTALYNAILLQRRLELAFEGSRFFDLKRLGLPVERSEFGDRADGSGIPVPEEAATLPANDPLFQLPIPQAEINANPNIKQNDY